LIGVPIAAGHQTVLIDKDYPVAGRFLKFEFRSNLRNDSNIQEEPSIFEVAQKNIAKLAVVVIARNEECHIADCLSALIVALRDFPGTRIILVDSQSTDRTVEIARQFSVEIYRYQGPPFSAAAGRRVGFSYAVAEYVLFVDGDCCVEPGWLECGLSYLTSDDRVGVVYGQRREIFGKDNNFPPNPKAPTERASLGGNGLYRSVAIERSGGFNPYLPAGEEAELLARIKAAGFSDMSVPRVMFTHFTIPNTTFRGYFDRVRRGLARGLGQTLRVSIDQGLFYHHARRLNRYLLSLAYLCIGIVALLLSLILREPKIFVTWGILGIAAFVMLWLRRRSLSSALFIFTDWFTIASYIPADFLRTPKKLDEFQPKVERLK
jgi:glycosyltransferase involved in cell wall biosynthesis